jgi:branched-chain amino acid aminotransferase
MGRDAIKGEASCDHSGAKLDAVMTTIRWRNGIWEESAFLEATQQVLTGQGVFETILVKEDVPQFLDLHLARLRNSSEILGIPTPELEIIKVGLRQLLVTQKRDLGRLRITIFGGTPHPQLMLSLVDMDPWPPSARVNVSPWIRNVNSAITGAKAASYAENAVALKLAREKGFCETLFFNSFGHLAEAATCNIAIVIDGGVFTPPLRSGCLPGITRQVLLEMDAIREVDVDINLLNSAAAVALLSCTRGVQPINAIGERGLDSTDEILLQLVEVYEARVVEDKENWAGLPQEFRPV